MRIDNADTDGNCRIDPDSGGLTTTCSSDARLKTDIISSPPVLSYLNGLPIKEYTVIASGDRRTGVVAQELLSAGYSSLVSMGEDGYYGVSEIPSWKIIKGVQELDAKINSLAGGSYITDSSSTPVFYGTRDIATVQSRDITLAADTTLIIGTTTLQTLCLNGDCRTSWPNVATTTIDLSAYATNASVTDVVNSLQSTVYSQLNNATSSLAASLAAQGDTLTQQNSAIALQGVTLASTTDALYTLASTTNAVLGGLTSGGSQTSGTSTPITGSMLALIDIPGLCVTGDTKLRRRRKITDVFGDDFDGFDGDEGEYATENAALAGGAPSTSRVAERYEKEVDTQVSIANRVFVSSSQNSPVYKAVEGLEPSRGEVSTSLSHRATACRRVYHAGKEYLTDGQWIYDEVAIVDIQAGDEIASLDEKTGDIVYRKVKWLAFMGVKDIFELETATGKKIRTTGNHPYLVAPRGVEDRKPRVGVFIDSSNLYHAAKKAGWQIDLRNLKDVFSRACNLISACCYVAMPRESDQTRSGMQAYVKAASRFFNVSEKPIKYIFDMKTREDIKKGDVDLEIAMDVVRALPGLDAVVIMSGDSVYLPLAKYTDEIGVPAVFMRSE